MTTPVTMTLAEFVLARIAEDESAAWVASGGGRWRYEDSNSVGAWTLYDEHWRIADLATYPRGEYDYAERMPAFRSPYYVNADANGAHIARWDPARVLAECEAKRRILQRARDWDGDGWWPDDVMRCLALPYVDHPDYREEWRP